MMKCVMSWRDIYTNETTANKLMQEYRLNSVGRIQCLIYLRKHFLNVLEELMLNSVLSFSLIPLDSEIPPKKSTEIHKTDQSGPTEFSKEKNLLPSFKHVSRLQSRRSNWHPFLER